MPHNFSQYDAWKLATPPEYDDPGPEPQDEPELPEPDIDEVWNGTAYDHVVRFADGRTFTVRLARAGPFVGDYEICGDGYYSDGWTSPDLAIDHLIDMARNP